VSPLCAPWQSIPPVVGADVAGGLVGGAEVGAAVVAGPPQAASNIAARATTLVRALILLFIVSPSLIVHLYRAVERVIARVVVRLTRAITSLLSA
jgi:hypothetical protein